MIRRLVFWKLYDVYMTMWRTGFTILAYGRNVIHTWDCFMGFFDVGKRCYRNRELCPICIDLDLHGQAREGQATRYTNSMFPCAFVKCSGHTEGTCTPPFG